MSVEVVSVVSSSGGEHAGEMVTSDEGPGEPEPQVVKLPSGRSRRDAEGVMSWVHYSFAKEWLEEARHEARSTPNNIISFDRRAQRREIVFAVCFAESYLVEWVRDEVLGMDDSESWARAVNRYFPPDDKRPILVRWKKVPKQLKDDGLISSTPDLGQQYWVDFQKLLDKRNGLVHGRSSRPEVLLQPELEKPLTTTGDLDQIQPGWATGVVVELVRKLHESAGTTVPDWLIKP